MNYSNILKGVVCISYFALLPIAHAENTPPFIGKASFAFTDGNCNVYVILIDKLGNTKISTNICSMSNNKGFVLYAGKFQDRMRIINSNYGIKGKYIFLEVNKKTASIVDGRGNIIYSEGCNSHGDELLAACLSPVDRF